ncbi:hypothetical protein FIBSPDRAFT_356538 [Athelia psychrophila]|uniref:Uncharacterized protein n=1 Tax=Athelia psychrophila TaxID=1759441 RepID=A0A167VS99_9AGAM|nr:hypothetical protein FIBSPDRAFT_356538 [Fibularhizoctonia sp. CBS 109695]
MGLLASSVCCRYMLAQRKRQDNVKTTYRTLHSQKLSTSIPLQWVNDFMLCYRHMQCSAVQCSVLRGEAELAARLN